MIENAKITNTYLGKEDHNIMTAYLTLSGDGWGCGFGGYMKPSIENISKLLDTLEVRSWEELKGQYLRAEFKSDNGPIVRIGHLLKNQWFSWED